MWRKSADVKFYFLIKIIAYSKNIDTYSKPLKGLVEFLDWAKNKNISMAVCTNKQERLAIDLLKKLDIYKYFEYVAGSDTFAFNKPDPRHLTDVVDILGGKIKKTIMIGDSETDSNAAKQAGITFILIEEGYTEKKTNQIYFDHAVKNFLGLEITDAKIRISGVGGIFAS